MNAPRSGCPINLTLEALGDSWSLIVIRDLMFGIRRDFRELLTRSEERIAMDAAPAVASQRVARRDTAAVAGEENEDANKATVTAAGRADEAAALREAIHEYFGQRVVATRRKLRELFRRGRISLVIALAFLARPEGGPEEPSASARSIQARYGRQMSLPSSTGNPEAFSSWASNQVAGRSCRRWAS